MILFAVSQCLWTFSRQSADGLYDIFHRTTCSREASFGPFATLDVTVYGIPIYQFFFQLCRSNFSASKIDNQHIISADNPLITLSTHQ